MLRGKGECPVGLDGRGSILCAKRGGSLVF